MVKQPAVAAALLCLATTALAQETVILRPPAQNAKEAKETVSAAEALQRAAFERNGAVGVMLLGQSTARKIIFCHGVGQTFEDIAAAQPNAATRKARLGEVWRYQQRLAEPFAKASGSMSETELRSARREAGEAMNVLSMMPDPKMEELYTREDDLLYSFVGITAYRCGQILDEMGIPALEGEPPASFLLAKAGFRFRGAKAPKVFAKTQLAPYASRMCMGDEAPDFSAAPLDQRGADGMSLLDWAMECDDQTAFAALIEAGADLDAAGLWQNPPLVNAASAKRLWYLRALLDAGINPNSKGRSGTALREAYRDLDAQNAGDTSEAAFNLLLERGASLTFPDYRNSMLNEWTFRDWPRFLKHWDLFEGDPVALGRSAESYLESRRMNEEHNAAAREVVRRLQDQYGVCFPVGATIDLEKDERGFYVQPDCDSQG